MGNVLDLVVRWWLVHRYECMSVFMKVTKSVAEAQELELLVGFNPNRPDPGHDVREGGVRVKVVLARGSALIS